MSDEKESQRGGGVCCWSCDNWSTTWCFSYERGMLPHWLEQVAKCSWLVHYRVRRWLSSVLWAAAGCLCINTYSLSDWTACSFWVKQVNCDWLMMHQSSNILDDTFATVWCLLPLRNHNDKKIMNSYLYLSLCLECIWFIYLFLFWVMVRYICVVMNFIFNIQNKKISLLKACTLFQKNIL